MGKERDEAGPKGKADDPERRLRHAPKLALSREAVYRVEDTEDAQQAERNHKEAGDGAAAERHDQCLTQASLGCRRRADVASHSDVHADEARDAGEEGADDEGDGCDGSASDLVLVLEDRDQHAHQDRDADGKDSDGAVLPVEVGERALEDATGDVLHPGRSGVTAEDIAGEPGGETNGDEPEDDDRQCIENSLVQLPLLVNPLDAHACRVDQYRCPSAWRRDGAPPRRNATRTGRWRCGKRT